MAAINVLDTDLDSFLDTIDDPCEQGFDLPIVIDKVSMADTHEDDVGWQARQVTLCYIRDEVCYGGRDGEMWYVTSLF